MLTDKEKERYNRHLIIDGFDEESQLRLKNGKVVVVGAGGLGCPVIQYLTAAGVGQITVIDGDVVSFSNLQRQVLFQEQQVGESKAVLVEMMMRKLNSAVKFISINDYLTEQLAQTILPGNDVIIGATDNFNSRYLIDRFSRLLNIPFVHGSIHEFEGQLSVFNYKDGYSYFDVFGDQPIESTRPIGVIGALPGVVGSMMAMEAIKIVTNVGEVNSNSLLLYDALKNNFRKILY